MMETIQLIELILKGPAGWLAIGIGAGVSGLATWLTAKRRYKKVRASTHAYLGGEKGFTAQNESDIDNLFEGIERYEQRVSGLIEEHNRATGGARADIAEHILKVAQQMMDEAVELSKMNIAFRLKDDHRQFIDRIDGCFKRARRIQAGLQQLQQRDRTLVRD